MTITALPTPPSRADSPGDFSAKADALLGALPAFVTEANALQADVNAKQATATDQAGIAAAQAGVATTQAGVATTQAAAAAASAASALAAPGTNATSATSVAVGTGAKSLTIQPGKSLAIGMSVVIAATASPANRMTGYVTAYDAGTGIVPAHRGQGLARRMLDHALPALGERGVEEFVLEVLQDNAPAIRAYRKAGFETTRALRSFVAAERVIPAQASSRWSLRPIRLEEFERMAEEMDWLPSFENRVSAVRAILSDVSLVGAFEKDRCVGAYAYSAPLRWLLSLVVCRSHRRLGVGRALLAHAAEHLPHGVERMAALNVDGADTGMQGFLRHLGFTPLVDQFEMRREVG